MVVVKNLGKDALANADLIHQKQPESTSASTAFSIAHDNLLLDLQ